MELLQSTDFWIGLMKIIWINIILSGDNAVVIALAARSLPPHQQKKAILFGSGAAVVLRIVLTVVAVQLLALSYLQIVGGLLLLWIGVQLLSEEEEGDEGEVEQKGLMAAVRTILIADIVMSLDNVIAVAAAAKGSTTLLIIGLAISIPLVIFGSTLMIKLMERYPAIVTLGAALIGWVGGETAEMPGMYPAGEYDLAGFAVGIAEKSALITGETIAEGDVVLGLASSGAHSNGYSLLRKILERDAPDLSADFHGRTLRETVLEPTRIYVKSLLALMKEAPGLVKGMAHITGGGLLDNVPRVLPAGLSAHIDAASWTLPPLFAWLREAGNVAEQEMYRVFNCGIGMVVIVSPADAERAMKSLADSGETVYRIGRIERCADGEAQTIVR